MMHCNFNIWIIKTVTKQVPRRIISSYPNLDGQTIREPTCPGAITGRQGNVISYLIYLIISLMHELVPKGQGAQAHSPKPLCVLRHVPKAYISYVLFVSQYLSVSQYLYLCNHHTTWLFSQKAKAPKYTAQSLYVSSEGPQRPFISSVSHVSRGEKYCLIILKTIITLIFIYLLTIL